MVPIVEYIVCSCIFLLLTLEKYVRSMNFQWYKSSYFHVLRRSVHIEDNRYFQEQSLGLQNTPCQPYI